MWLKGVVCSAAAHETVTHPYHGKKSGQTKLNHQSVLYSQSAAYKMMF